MLQKKPNYTLAVAGATGVAGRELLEVLEERSFPLSDIFLFDSEEAAGERLEFRGKPHTVKKLDKDCFTGVDIAFFAIDPENAIGLARSAVQSGAVVIDLSGAFRMDPAVPLVVPGVNAQVLSRHRGIIASPGPSSVATATVVKPIHQAVSIKRMAVTLLESVSSAGKKAMDELAAQTVALLNFRDIETNVYPHQIAFNCLPQIGTFLEDAATSDERNLENETKKILDDDSVRMSVTAVQVPVFRCHSQSVIIETLKPATTNEVRALLSSVPGLIVYDDPSKNLYPTAIDVAGKDEIYVGRIREDASVPNGVGLWIVSDNLRNGTALNAVQIAELVIS